MRVLFVYRDATRSTGGLSIDVRNLANTLVAGGHEAAVLGAATGEQTAARPTGLADSVAVRELRSSSAPGMGSFGLARGVGDVMRELDADVVHVFSCMPVYLHFAAIAADRRLGTPVVWTPMIHPLRELQWSSYGLAGRAMRAFDATAPRLARKVDAVAAATVEEEELFRRLGSGRVELIPPAVPGDPPEDDGEAGEVRERIGGGSGPLLLCVAGRVERRKGIPFCLEAFRLLRGRVPGARLALVASGLEQPLPDGVTLQSGLSDRDLRLAYRAADLAFVPSAYEAFSRVVIESWEQARPVVVTDRVGLASAVRDEGGLVAAYGRPQEAADAIEALSSDSGRAAAYGKRGRELVEAGYSVEVVADRAQALYEDLTRA